MNTNVKSRLTAGIRTEVRIESPQTCPVAAVTAETGSSVSSVDRSAPASDGTVTEDFTLDADEAPSQGDLTQIYADVDFRTYRFSRQEEQECACDVVETFGLPVSDVHAEKGALLITFLSPNIETVRDIVGALKDRFAGVAIRRLTRSGNRPNRDLVLLDRNPFTDRQLEVLQTAHEMGYFSYPKGANAGDVADALDICPSTFSEHLSAAQQKILDQLLASPSR